MNQTFRVFFMAIWFLGPIAHAMGDGNVSAPPPNIVLVVADDLGYGDLQCYGSKYAKTPNLDHFATEGLRLTQCYAGHANCSPSRAALLTGRTPMRLGIRSAIPLESPMHLRREEVTIAKILKQKGYATAHVGKWHLNGKFNSKEQPQPGDHGFDHWFSTQNNALPNHRNPKNFVRNGVEVGTLEGYAGRLVADEAIAWLDQMKDRNQPFFLYTCFHEPHEPIATDPAHAQKFPSDDPSFTAYYGNIAQLDHEFGRLMQALKRRGLQENTLVWFTSDNGPALTAIHPHGSSGGLRDKKGSLWEGGIRVPGILRWPSKIPAGMESDQPVSGVDFLPTICNLVSASLPEGKELDGTSIAPLWKESTISRRKPLYWHFPGASGGPKVALRDGEWKIVATLSSQDSKQMDIDEQSERRIKTDSLATFQLYHLGDDEREIHDRSADSDAPFLRMKQLVLEEFENVRQETPIWPYWKFENLEAKRIEWPDYDPRKKNGR